MIKYVKNNDGVALLLVMSIVTVSTLIIYLIFFMLNAESRMNYNYLSYGQANQAAEAGADYTINKWIEFINALHDPDPNNPPNRLTNTINLCQNIKINGTEYGGFKDYLDSNKSVIEENLNSNINFELMANGISGHSELMLSSCGNKIDINDTEPSKILIVKVTGKYNRQEYACEVKLQYSMIGEAEGYKGER